MNELKRLKAGIGVSVLTASLLCASNVNTAYASESDSNSTTETDSTTTTTTTTDDSSDDSLLSIISQKITKITVGGSNTDSSDTSSDSTDSSDSDTTTNSKNITINITGISRDKTYDRTYDFSRTNEYTSNSDKTSTSTSSTNYQSTKSSGSTSSTGSTGSSKSSTSSSSSSSSDDSTKKKGALATVIETIEDEDVPTGNDYLSSDWTKVGEEAPTCTEDGYANYYNSETGEMQTVVEKATGHDYTTEIEDGGWFHKDTAKTYCKNCGEVVSEEQVGSDFSIAGVLAALATLGSAIFLKKH